MATEDPIREKIKDILTKHGIPLETTIDGGFSDEGYESVLVNGAGKVLCNQDEILREVKPWPEGCWEEIQEVYRG